MNFKTVTAKLAKMRKPQEFIVQAWAGNEVYIQSDKATGSFDPKTGEGRFTTSGPYFTHLSFACPYTFPKSFVEECMKVLA
jgi:hypothetical protein